MHGRIIFGLVGCAVIGALAVGAALATPPVGLVPGGVIARGAAGVFDIHDKSQRFKVQAKEPIDVAVVKATLTPRSENPPDANGVRPLSETGWHGHVADSLLIVSRGQVTLSQPSLPKGRECSVETFGAGQTFVHLEGAHNIVAGEEGAEFFIVYFLPAGASPAPIDVTPAPEVCAEE